MEGAEAATGGAAAASSAPAGRGAAGKGAGGGGSSQKDAASSPGMCVGLRVLCCVLVRGNGPDRVLVGSNGWGGRSVGYLSASIWRIIHRALRSLVSNPPQHLLMT